MPTICRSMTGRAISTGCCPPRISLQESDGRYAAYLEGIHAIFDRWAENGRIVIPTETVAYVGAYSAVGE